MEGVLRKPELSEVDRRWAESFDLDASVVYFPVRHHSPACAYYLQQVIQAYCPDAMLIEGPSDADFLIPYLTDGASVPPLCIYQSYDDSSGAVDGSAAKYRAYYPFLSYSPEWVALRMGREQGISCRFMDMPYAVRLLNRPSAEKAELQFWADRETNYDANRYTSLLVERSGLRSFFEFWEKHFELQVGRMEVADFVRRLYSLGYFMRKATPADSPEWAEDCLRERYMAREIRRQQEAGSRRILVVCGAFHVAGLQEAVQTTGSGEGGYRLPAKDAVASYLMPYSFREVDSRSGYAAGLPFPTFYQSVWDTLPKRTESDPYLSVVLHYLIHTGRTARKSQTLSLADEMSAYQMAQSLAGLRGKCRPGVFELLDAVKSCFVKGDIHSTPSFVMEGLHRLLSGMEAGKTVENEFVPPVVQDFRAQCTRFRIRMNTLERQEMTLEVVRNPKHRAKSRFLHRMKFLETGFAQLTSGPDYVRRTDRNKVRELWVCRYRTQVETCLTDWSVFGSTLEQVCMAKLEQAMEEPIRMESLGDVLVEAQVMGLSDFYGRYAQTIERAIDRERNLPELCMLMGRLHELAAMQWLAEERVNPWVDGWLRKVAQLIAYLIPSVRSLPEGEEGKVARLLRKVYQWVQAEGFESERLSFLQGMAVLQEDASGNGGLYGLALAVCFKEKYGGLKEAEFGRRVCAYLETCVNHPAQATSFMGGVLLAAREVLWLHAEVLAVLDRIVCAMPQEEFVQWLPGLREVFTCYLPQELERLGRQVAELHGRLPEEESWRRMVSVSEAEVMEAMRLDAAVARRMKEWRI